MNQPPREQTKKEQMKSLAFETGLKSLEEIQAEDEAWSVKRAEFLTKYPLKAWQQVHVKIIKQLIKNLKTKAENIVREGATMRQAGVPYLERKKHVADNQQRLHDFKAKYIKRTTPPSEWLEEEDVAWIEKRGLESFILNNLEKMV